MHLHVYKYKNESRGQVWRLVVQDNVGRLQPVDRMPRLQHVEGHADRGALLVDSDVRPVKLRAHHCRTPFIGVTRDPEQVIQGVTGKWLLIVCT